MASLDHKEFNTLRAKQNVRYFEDSIFKFIFLNDFSFQFVLIWFNSTFYSVKRVPKRPISNDRGYIQVVA